MPSLAKGAPVPFLPQRASPAVLNGGVRVAFRSAQLADSYADIQEKMNVVKATLLDRSADGKVVAAALGRMELLVQQGVDKMYNFAVMYAEVANAIERCLENGSGDVTIAACAMIRRCLELCPSEFEDFVLDLLPLLLRLVVRGTGERVVRGADATVRGLLRTYCGIADRLSETPRITLALLNQMELAVLHGAGGLRMVTLHYFVTVVGFCLEGIARRTILTQHNERDLVAEEAAAEAELAAARFPKHNLSKASPGKHGGASGGSAKRNAAANEAARKLEGQLQQTLDAVRAARQAEADRLPFGLQATALVEAYLPSLCDRVLWNALSDCAVVGADDMSDFGLPGGPKVHFDLVALSAGSHGKSVSSVREVAARCLWALKDIDPAAADAFVGTLDDETADYLHSLTVIMVRPLDAPSSRHFSSAVRGKGKGPSSPHVRTDSATVPRVTTSSSSSSSGQTATGGGSSSSSSRKTSRKGKGRAAGGAVGSSPSSSVSVVEYPSGGVYTGQLKAGKRHGLGTFTSAGGDVYEGQYRDGKMHGEGTMSWAGVGEGGSGDVYEGGWVDGRREGECVYSPGDGGPEYRGMWKDEAPVRMTKPREGRAGAVGLSAKQQQQQQEEYAAEEDAEERRSRQNNAPPPARHTAGPSPSGVSTPWSPGGPMPTIVLSNPFAHNAVQRAHAATEEMQGADGRKTIRNPPSSPAHSGQTYSGSSSSSSRGGSSTPTGPKGGQGGSGGETRVGSSSTRSRVQQRPEAISVQSPTHRSGGANSSRSKSRSGHQSPSSDSGNDNGSGNDRGFVSQDWQSNRATRDPQVSAAYFGSSPLTDLAPRRPVNASSPQTAAAIAAQRESGVAKNRVPVSVKVMSDNPRSAGRKKEAAHVARSFITFDSDTAPEKAHAAMTANAVRGAVKEAPHFEVMEVSGPEVKTEWKIKDAGPDLGPKARRKWAPKGWLYWQLTYYPSMCSEAALVIQDVVRYYLAQCHMAQDEKACQNAASVMQSMFKMHAVKSQYRKRQRANLALQKNIRAKSQKIMYSKKKDAIIILQAASRGRADRKRVAQLVAKRKEAELVAAELEKSLERSEEEAVQASIQQHRRRTAEASRLEAELQAQAWKADHLQQEHASKVIQKQFKLFREYRVSLVAYETALAEEEKSRLAASCVIQQHYRKHTARVQHKHDQTVAEALWEKQNALAVELAATMAEREEDTHTPSAEQCAKVFADMDALAADLKIRLNSDPYRRAEAATSLQSLQRGRVARKEAAVLREQRQRQRAATTLQSAQRGRVARADVEQVRLLRQVEAEEQQAAGLKITAVARGRQGRDRASLVKKGKKEAAAALKKEQDEAAAVKKERDEAAAALKITAVVRGRQGRKQAGVLKREAGRVKLEDQALEAAISVGDAFGKRIGADLEKGLLLRDTEIDEAVRRYRQNHFDAASRISVESGSL